MKNIFVCFKDLQTGPPNLIPILKEFGLKEFKNVLDENQFYDLKKDKFNVQSSTPKPDTTQSSKVSKPLIKKKMDSTQSSAMMQSIVTENEYTQKLFRIWKIVLKDGVDDEKVLKKLQGLDFIEFAHFANIYQLHANSNDPRHNDQWHIPQIQADLAWAFTQGNGSIVVAVIDSGVDYNHIDINQNMWRNSPGGNYGFDMLTGGEDPMDMTGHGTHVAGLIGAIINNNIATNGIAKVKIMAIKAFGGAEDDDGYMVRALWKAAEMGAKIVNNSWGPKKPQGPHTTLETALRALASLNIICVFSAGNRNRKIDTVFPGKRENDIIIVAGSKRNDTKTDDSNFGDKVTIVAPGLEIYSLHRISGTNEMGGTSAAAPIVSGAIALLLTHSPNLTLAEIKNLLRISSDRLVGTGTNFNTNTGRLNIYNLLLANNPALRSQARTISENPLPHPLNERNMNPEIKRFELFQFILVNYLKTKLNRSLQDDIGIDNISDFITRIISDNEPEVDLIEQIEMTEKLLWIYRDVAEMYSILDSPDLCPSGYYVCTTAGVTTCCPNGQIMLVANEPENEEAEPINISDLLKNNVFLYWNCDVSIYHTINPNMETKKVQVEEIFLRPNSGIKILDLNDIEDINVNNIKTIHFGAPYNIFINL